MDNQILVWGLTALLALLAIVNLVFDVRHPSIETATWQKWVSNGLLIGFILCVILNYSYRTNAYTYAGAAAVFGYFVMNSPFVKGPLAKKRAHH